MFSIDIQLFGGMSSGVGQVPRGAGSAPDIDFKTTGNRLNQLEDYAEQYQRDHRAELKQYGIKRSGFITSWDDVGSVHEWGFDGNTKNGSTHTTVLNNGFVTKFYTKGKNSLLGSKMYSSLDAAIKGAEKFLGYK